MKFFELLCDLLGCKTEDLNEAVKRFLLEVHRDLALILDEDQASEVRARTERLSSYLGRLNTALASYRQFMDFKRNVWVRDHPKPEKGVTEWRDSMDAELSEPKRICEYVEGTIKSIDTRISATQSNMKNKVKES